MNELSSIERRMAIQEWKNSMPGIDMENYKPINPRKKTVDSKRSVPSDKGRGAR
jgi:hypothetical protein